MIGIRNLLMNTTRWKLTIRWRRVMLSNVPLSMVRLYLTFLCLLTPWYAVSSDYTVYKVDNDHYKVSVDVDNPVFYRAWGYPHAGNDGRTVRPTYWLRGSTGTGMSDASASECRQTSSFPLEAYTHADHEDHETAIRSALTILNSCTFTYRPTGTGVPSWGLLRIYVGVSSGQYLASIDLGPGSLESEPNQCQVYLEPMTFGLVLPDTTPVAEADIQVSCSRDANVTVTTNGGRQFIDPASDAIISFIDPPTFVLSSCSEYCVVPIEGRMIKVPNRPGSYKWFVPVLVEYQ